MGENRSFGSSEALLRHIQEKSDDIVKVRIPLSPAVKDPVAHTVTRGVGMIVFYSNGKGDMLSVNDAELVLNDGILNRMGLPIGLLCDEG